MTSNVQTRAVKTFRSHPLRFYYDFGIRVTINTDNRLVTDTTVTKEYKTAVDTFGFDAWDVKQLITNGFKSAFLPFHERQLTLRKISQELDELIAEETALHAPLQAQAQADAKAGKKKGAKSKGSKAAKSATSPAASA